MNEEKCKHGIFNVPLAECSICWLEKYNLQMKKEQLLKEYKKGNYKPLIIDEEKGERGC